MSFVFKLIKKILFFILLILFVSVAAFNHQLVELNLLSIKTIKIPLFFIILCSILLGSFINLVYFLFSKK